MMIKVRNFYIFKNYKSKADTSLLDYQYTFIFEAFLLKNNNIKEAYHIILVNNKLNILTSHSGQKVGIKNVNIVIPSTNQKGFNCKNVAINSNKTVLQNKSQKFSRIAESDILKSSIAKSRINQKVKRIRDTNKPINRNNWPEKQS